MLVLSRKINEKIVINGNIVITVVRIDRDQVRVGIEAPDEIPILRGELLNGGQKPSQTRPPEDDRPHTTRRPDNT